MAKFKAWPESGHLVVVPPKKRGEPPVRYSLYADKQGIIETDDPAAIKQLRQSSVVEEIHEPRKKAVKGSPEPEKKAVEEPTEPDKATVEGPEPEPASEVRLEKKGSQEA